MQWLEIIILLLAGIIFFNYAGYAIIAGIIAKLFAQKKPAVDTIYQPNLSFIVAAYNEEDIIEDKILNTLALDYPANKIELLFITDGSTDQTNEIISRYSQVKLLFQPERKGKSAALNRVVESASHEILVFSDANTFLNPEALGLMMQHYADPRTGGVSGEKKVKSLAKSNANSEGLYWKYESLLKKIDSAFYSLVGAAGELFSVRKSLYVPVAENVLLDDFVISMRVVTEGFKVKYEPAAYGAELGSAGISEEEKRKVRIAMGGFQAMKEFRHLYRFWKTPRLSYLYISHRVLRWAVTPFCLPLLLIINIIAVIMGTSPLFVVLLAAQLLFYLSALIGYGLYKKGIKISIFNICYYFVFMNISVIKGFIKYLDRKNVVSGAWEKSKREMSQTHSGLKQF